MARNNSQEAIHDFIRLFMGLILGSGIAGAAVKMVQETPDARAWGAGILAGCIVAAVFMLLLGEVLVGRRERRRLRKLGDAYVRALNTTGQRLVDKLETAFAEGRLQTSEMRTFVLDTLAKLLQKQSEEHQGEEDESEWVKAFRASLQHTVNEWTVLAAVEQKEGHFPPDATPEKIS